MTLSTFKLDGICSSHQLRDVIISITRLSRDNESSKYPNFVGTRESWIELLRCHQYPNVRVRPGTAHEMCSKFSKFGYSSCQCTKSIQNFWVVTKFGYWRQCSKSMRNFRLLDKIRLLTSMHQIYSKFSATWQNLSIDVNAANLWEIFGYLIKFGYWRQCTKYNQNFEICQVSEWE